MRTKINHAANLIQIACTMVGKPYRVVWLNT